MWMCPAMPAPAALPLRELDHFIGGIDRQLLQLVEMGVGDYHDMARSVGIRVQDYEAVLAAMND